MIHKFTPLPDFATSDEDEEEVLEQSEDDEPRVVEITDPTTSDTEPLFKFPALVNVVSPYEGGKTTLIKYLLLQHAAEITCVVVFSTSGYDSYETDYSFTHKRYVNVKFKPGCLDAIRRLGKRIKKRTSNSTLS